MAASVFELLGVESPSSVPNSLDKYLMTTLGVAFNPPPPPMWIYRDAVMLTKRKAAFLSASLKHIPCNTCHISRVIGSGRVSNGELYYRPITRGHSYWCRL